MDCDGTRKLDTAIPASIDHVALNNQIVGMRKTVKRTKVQLINRMVQRVRQLKNSRGSEMAVAKKQRKAERILQEIQVIKNLDPDKVSKYALANTSTVKDVANLPPSSETKAMARYANHKILQEAIATFREKHSDWKALAAYLLTKNTGRRFKKKATKEKTTLEAAVTNKKAGESLMKTFLQQKMGDSTEVDVNESEGLLKEKNKHRTTIKAVGTCTINSPEESSTGEKIGHPRPVKSVTMDEEEFSEDSAETVERKQSCDEMVVESISLDNLDEDMFDFTHKESKKSLPRGNDLHDVISTTDSNEDQIPRFLKLSDKNSKTVKVKKDSFFMCNDEEMDSGNESNEEKPLHNENDDDDDDDDNLAQIQKGKLAMRSTFLGSLTDNKKEKIGLGKRPLVRQVREKGHSQKGHGGQLRGTSGHRGMSKTFQRDHPYNPSKPAAKQTNRHSEQWKQNTYKKLQPSSETSTRDKPDRPGKHDKEEKLHPSWEASKQRKQQVSQLQAFQGKRTTFTDD